MFKVFLSMKLSSYIVSNLDISSDTVVNSMNFSFKLESGNKLIYI